MSNAVVPEKRPNSGYDDMQEKRLKIGDLPTAMNLQSDGEALHFCMICDCKTDHFPLKCPKRSEPMGWACTKCLEPCEIKEHDGNRVFSLKVCLYCDVLGDHWSKGCPKPIYDDDDIF